MKKVHGNKILSYVLSILSIILIVNVFIPQWNLWRGEKENSSVRLEGEEIVEIVSPPQNDNLNSFTECHVFGINKLIKDYYEAYIEENDDEILKYTDTFGNMDISYRKFCQNNIERFIGFQCYYMNGLIDDSYLVLSYGYAKCVGISTPVPIIGKFYVRMNAGGNYYICNSEISSENSAYNQSMFESNQARELFEMAKYELDTACEVDNILRVFVQQYKEYFSYTEVDNGDEN